MFPQTRFQLSTSLCPSRSGFHDSITPKVIALLEINSLQIVDTNLLEEGLTQVFKLWEGKGESHGTPLARIADLNCRYRNQEVPGRE